MNGSNVSPKPVVLLVSGEYPPYTNWGGNAYQLASLAKLLNRHGYQVEVIAESDNGEEFTHLDAAGNLVHRISGHRSYARKSLGVLSRGLMRRLDFRDLWFSARVAEKALELETVWNRRFLWIETTNWRAETLVLQLVPELNRRTVVRIVTPMEEVVRQNQLDRHSPDVRAALAQELVLHILARHRLYSNPEYKEYFEERVKVPTPFRKADGRIFLLPFDFHRVPVVPPPTSSTEERPLRLLMIGRIEPRKGFDTVGSALAGLSPEERRRFRIVAVGRDTPFGPFESYQRLLMEKYPGIAEECFEFRGGVSEELLRAAFAECDAGMVASTSESFGYNLVELLASNLPVITSRVGAAAELERRGVRYLGSFTEPHELTEIFRNFETLRNQLRVDGVDNRRTLEHLYAANDARYFEFVRSIALESGSPPRRPRLAKPIRSVDVVVCSYNRMDELMLSLPSLLSEVERVKSAGVECTVTVVYQNAGLPDRVHALRPDFKPRSELRFVFSDPPSLTIARNTGIQNTSGELVIFVDDDVILEPGFVQAHVDAANAHPDAVGVVGRVQSRIERQRTTEFRAVGHIRASGHIDTNFDSVVDSSPIVPMTPMGTNMAYRRAAMEPVFGSRWFDERFVGSAFREETTLAVRIFRAGLHFVYAPDAVLYHYESVAGGCENRNDKRTLAQLARHYALDYLFLNTLYSTLPLGRDLAPLLLLVRDVRQTQGRKQKLRKLYVNLRGYVGGRRKFASPGLGSEPGSDDGAQPDTRSPNEPTDSQAGRIEPPPRRAS